MLKQKTSERGAPPAPQAKIKKANGEMQTSKNNFIHISNQVDAAYEEDLLGEEATLRYEGEET